MLPAPRSMLSPSRKLYSPSCKLFRAGSGAGGRSPISYLLVALAFPLLVAFSPAARGQGSALNKTSFGKSQNSAEDLQNSLTPGKPNLTKGEKKSEVDPKKLPSKSTKDPLFQGGLMDVNVDWTGSDKLGKPRTANESDPKIQKKAEATEDPKAAAKNADPARDKDSKPSKSEPADAGQNKDQKTTSAAANEKPSEKEKTSTSKPDSDR